MKHIRRLEIKKAIDYIHTGLHDDGLTHLPHPAYKRALEILENEIIRSSKK